MHLQETAVDKSTVVVSKLSAQRFPVNLRQAFSLCYYHCAGSERKRVAGQHLLCWAYLKVYLLPECNRTGPRILMYKQSFGSLANAINFGRCELCSQTACFSFPWSVAFNTSVNPFFTAPLSTVEGCWWQCQSPNIAAFSCFHCTCRTDSSSDRSSAWDVLFLCLHRECTPVSGGLWPWWAVRVPALHFFWASACGALAPALSCNTSRSRFQNTTRHILPQLLIAFRVIWSRARTERCHRRVRCITEAQAQSAPFAEGFVDDDVAHSESSTGW